MYEEQKRAITRNKLTSCMIFQIEESSGPPEGVIAETKRIG